MTAENDFDVFYQKWRSPILRSLALTLGDVGLADEAVDEAMTRALHQLASHVEIGFLYATSTGAPYELGEFEFEDGEIQDLGPLGGGIGLKVRLSVTLAATLIGATGREDENQR